MEEQVPDWAQDSAIPDWAKDDSSDTSITPKAPETDKAAWEQIRDFAKAPSPSWLQKIEEPVRGFLNQPALPDPATIRAFRQKMGFSDQPASGADLVEGWYNAARGMVTPANAVIAAGMAAQPETVPYLLPFMFAPMAAEQPDRWKRVIQGQADLKETGETQAQTAMLLAPLIHAGAAKATDAAFPVPPTLPRPGVTALSPIEYVRKYQQAPEDLTGIPDQPQAETPPVASQEVPGSPGFARFQGEVTPQETDESAQARAHAAMKKLDDLGGNWEYIHQALTEEHGEPPTYGELANELEDEIKDLTSTPREALKNYEIGLARRRTRQAQAREDALAQQEGREPNKVPTITPAQIRADYLRREAEATRVWMEQAFPKKSGEQPVRQKGVKYAKQPGYAQMEEGPTSLRVETRPGGQVPGPGNRYQTERGAQGEAAGRPVSQQPRPASQPVAPEAPPENVPPPVKPSGVSIPIMITKKMEADLRDRGFLQEEINKLTPQQAHDAISSTQTIGIEPATKTKTFRVRAPRDEYANSPETPVATAVSEMGGLLSKSAASRRGKLEGNEALWNDPPKLADLTHRKIYNLDGEMPDVMAQTLHDAGLIMEPTTDAMYRELERESHTIKGKLRAEKKAAAVTKQPEKQAANFGKGQRAEAESGTKAVPASALNVGDTVTVDGMKLKVTDVSPDDFTVTLENGQKYGVQEVNDQDVIYGEHKPTTTPAPESELAPEPASEAPSPRQARGQAFKIVGPREANTYKHTGTGLIVRGRKSPQTGQWTWEAIHPDTGEVLNVQTSRRRAMDANLAGALEQPKPAPLPKPAPAKAAAPEPVEPLAKLGDDFEKNHGKPMTPQEEKQAQKIVDRAKSDNEEYQKAHQDLIKTLDTEYGRLKGPEITSKKDLGKLLSDPDKEVC